MTKHSSGPGGDPSEQERRLLRGVALEWEASLYVLAEAQRTAMRQPLFSLRDGKRTWGSWSREQREIALSRDLVLNHSWDAVREVLLHETAHQMADEVLGGGGEPPHGPAFLRACALLRANPRASGRYTPLDDRLRGDGEREEDRTTRRVRKLLALARSPNRNEAEASMEKAHDLMARYNMDLLERDAERDFESVFVGAPALRHPPEDYELAHLLLDFYFVQGIWVPAYVSARGKMGRVLEISGTVRNVRLASYVHDFVRRYIDRSWSGYNDGKGLGRRRKSDFAVGVLQGFRSRIEQRQEKGGPRTARGALVRIEDPRLTRYMAERHPHTVSVRRFVRGRDEEVLAEGTRAGRRLVIHQGIHARGEENGRRLGPGSTPR